MLNLSYLRYTNKTRAEGIHDLPALSCNTSVLPDYIALYNHPADYHRTPLTAVAFYLYDSEFDGKDGLYNAIYYDDAKRQQFFRERFAGVNFFISPDVSQFGDLDDLENHYRIKKSRVIAVWLAMELGAVVIPHITFPTMASIDFSLDGLEDCSVVAFSTKGYVSDPVERAILEESVRYTVDKLSLKAIVVYDVCATDENALEIFKYAIESGVEVVVPNNMLKERNAAMKGGASDEG
ncbi:MAG: DUF4417 domain-containing protein [Coriobacteriia bacterium]|nr:DUF4417 domain-containing protein [Coriobacteriia bacterium]